MKSIVATLCLLLAGVPLAAQSSSTSLALNRPAATIGVADGDSAYLLFGARGAARLPGGGIAVMNSGSNEIRVFDARGRHVRTMGRKGDGPGEFRGLQHIGALAADSVIAYDVYLGRLTVFGPDGRLARTTQITPFINGVLPRAVGFTGNGRLLAHTDFDRVFSPGVQRDTMTFALFDRAGVPRDTLGVYPGAEEFILTADGIGLKREIAFGRTTIASARGSHIVIGTNETLRYDVFSSDGKKITTQAGSIGAPRAVSRDDVAAADEAYMEARPQQIRELIRKNLKVFPHRDTYPAFGDLTVSTDGSVWVQVYPKPGAKARQWAVYNAAGKKIRDVTSPYPLELLDVGADYAIGWMRDELDVEQILLFEFSPVSF